MESQQLTLYLALIIILFSVPFFLASRLLEHPARKALARRGAILLIGATLPILVYWILTGKVDELTLALASLAAAILAICLLVWSLYKHYEE